MLDQQTIKEIELNIQEMRDSVAATEPAIQTAERLTRLLDNEDFKEIIMKGYLEEFAVTQVRMLARPEMQGEREQAACNKAIAGIGTLWGYLDAINAAANSAQHTRQQSLEAIEQLENSLAEDEYGLEV